MKGGTFYEPLTESSVSVNLLHWRQRFDTGRKRGIKIVRVFCSIQGFGPECIPAGLKRPILKKGRFSLHFCHLQIPRISLTIHQQ